MADPKQQQVEITERLQLKLLQRFERLIDDGELSATDAATLTRLLMQNGWQLDPSRMPKKLSDLLTSKVSFDEDEDDSPFAQA